MQRPDAISNSFNHLSKIGTKVLPDAMEGTISEALDQPRSPELALSILQPLGATLHLHCLVSR